MQRKPAGPPSLWPLILAVVIAYGAMFLLIIYLSSVAPH